MLKTRRLIGSGLFVLILFGAALAQEKRTPNDNRQEPSPDALPGPVPAAPLVTATATAKRVRFVSPGTVVQLRLEVYNEAGQRLFDTELHGGNVLDWYLQDGAGQPLPAGSYVSVLTIKSLSGRLSQRVGVVTVNDEKTAIEPVAGAQLSLAQQQAIGPVADPVEGNAGFTVLQPSEAEAITAVTHDGTDGQVSRTRGALSFRVGDFFAGKDKEQMRLTEGGQLGIGTSDPQAKLDVAGTIRAERVLIARPGNSGGTDQMVAAVAANATDVEQSLVSGSGTQDRIAKWIDNAGTLGDSTITEVGGRVGIGVTNPTYKLVVGPDIGFGLTTSDLTVSRGPGQSVSAYVGANGSNGMNFGWDQANQRAFVNAPVQSPITFTHGGVSERMRIGTDGNVGIGTNNPGSLLDVGGDVNTSTQYKIGGNRVFSIAGNGNTFAGRNAGIANTSGLANSFFGHMAGVSNTTGGSNAFFGAGAGINNLSGDANSFFGAGAGESNTTGQLNSFFGKHAGSNNRTGNSNSFFGETAGGQNTTGCCNSFFGLSAGYRNTDGEHNSAFGFYAGYNTIAGANNSFFGYQAGSNNTASGNSFFGHNAGLTNTTGTNNAFFGGFAGQANTASGNSFFGHNAGLANTDGTNNAFFGGFAGQANTGSGNSFFGRSAGFSNTTGFGNAFFGFSAGQANTTSCCNAFFGGSAGFANTTGENNSFFGNSAGAANVGGNGNSFFGKDAGTANTASSNSFFGSLAGSANTAGSLNSFFGALAGQANTQGSENAFFGNNAGTANTQGATNSFFGSGAGAGNTTGHGNILIGHGAGSNVIAGIDNVYIANVSDILAPPPDESNHIRIGMQGIQTATLIAGISGTPMTGDAVFVDANGQLGVSVSSRRFKQDIRAMGNASSKLMQLRPVVFHYRPEYASGKPTLQYGLIAEEVAKVYPELVGFDADGKPQTVRYNLLNTMLLNEAQRQEAHIQSQARQLQSQAQQIANLEARLRRIELQASVGRRRR